MRFQTGALGRVEKNTGMPLEATQEPEAIAASCDPRLLKRKWSDYLALPPQVSPYERSYLARMNRLALAFLALHVPIVSGLAWLNHTGTILAGVLSLATLALPCAPNACVANPRITSVLIGISAMLIGGLLVHFGQGPMQMEMHFFFFALIAMLAAFANPTVIVAAAMTVAVHHMILWAVLPHSVFNYEAPIWVLGVHAAFIIMDSVAACFVARTLFDNVIGLEKIVSNRTAQVADRNRDLRLVLNNMAQGCVTIDRRGVMANERSLILDKWLGLADPGDTLFDLLERVSVPFAETSRIHWEEVAAGEMPIDLTLSQMPKKLVVDTVTFHLEYSAIGPAEVADRFLVVITDVTSDVVRERAEQDHRETLQILERALNDRGAVQDFFTEASLLVQRIVQDSEWRPEHFRRMVHTLKGNCAIFGVRSVASLCEQMENFMEESASAPPLAMKKALESRWSLLAANLDGWVGTRRRVIEVDEKDHSALEHAVRHGLSARPLFEMVHSLRLEPTQRRLDLLCDQARRIASRLEKSLDLRADGHGLKLDPLHWAGFWSAFVHVVRNAVDHGVEGPEARASKGKAPQGCISMRTEVLGDRFVVEISDDGNGLDWERIAKKAVELGIPSKTESDLIDALFHDGFSTAPTITDLSGRGVGMGALREATLSMGGRIEVESAKDVGTTWRMTFPKEKMAPVLFGSRWPAVSASITLGALQ